MPQILQPLEIRNGKADLSRRPIPLNSNFTSRRLGERVDSIGRCEVTACSKGSRVSSTGTNTTGFAVAGLEVCSVSYINFSRLCRQVLFGLCYPPVLSTQRFTGEGMYFGGQMTE